MSTPAFTWDDKAFTKALRQYLDLKKNVNPAKELRRRGKNVGIRLIKIYKEKGVVLADITDKVKSLGYRVKIRQKIRLKGKLTKRGKWRGITRRQMIAAELRARKSAKGFTATGWFPSVTNLGGNPKREMRSGSGPRRGKLIEKLGSGEMSETLVNQQPGAGLVQTKNRSLEQAALDAETADMVIYIDKKLREAAAKNGL